MGWNGDKVTIEYVGPMDKSPFYKPQLRHLITDAKNAKIGPLDASGGTTIYQAYVQPNDYTYNSVDYKTAVHVEQIFTSAALSQGTVDLLQTLNSLNVNQAHWMQGSIMYDDALILGSTANWYANFDSWGTGSGCLEDTGLNFPQALQMNSASGHTILENNYANGGGTYSMYVTDNTAGTGQSMSVNYGDSGANLNLDIPSGTSCASYGGTDMEEIEKNSGQTDQKWGNIEYSFDFWATTSQSSPVTTCNSWTYPNNYPASTTTNTPACHDYLSY